VDERILLERPRQVAGGELASGSASAVVIGAALAVGKPLPQVEAGGARIAADKRGIDALVRESPQNQLSKWVRADDTEKGAGQPETGKAHGDVEFGASGEEADALGHVEWHRCRRHTGNERLANRKDR
jgi:hypothetical protein